MVSIGILGGTFDPVHVEHVRLAKCAIKELGLNKLLVMPTFLSPHKTTNPAPAKDRFAMLKKAFEGVSEVEVSDFEILKEGKSYTYQTVEHFSKTTNAKLYFIVGGDMLTDFKTWRYPERILSCCTLAVFGRDGFKTDFSFEKKYFKEQFGKEFVTLSYVGSDESSTKIRVYSSFGLDVEGMTDEGVAQYIRDNNLYKGDKYVEYIKSNLPKKRIIHTANVVITALKKAKELNLSPEKVKTTATLHDCAKYLRASDYKDFNLPKDVPAPVEHAFLGAYVAEKILEISDEEILEAIKYHTSGKAEMSQLAKLIFVADMVEEGRDYEGVEELRKLYEGKDFDSCFVECLKEEFLHLLNKKQKIYQETVNAVAYYVKD